MRSFTQNKDGSGNNAESDFIDRGLRRLEELQFYDSQTIKVEQTTRGTRFHAKPVFLGASSGWRWSAKSKKWSKDNSYSGDKIGGEIIEVLANDPLCDFAGAGTVDPDSGLTVFATPGLYVCNKNVAPVVNPSGLPAGTYYRIPQWPPPQTAPPIDGVSFDPDDEKVYWWLISNPPCF